ncbi:MAG TPA: tRNA (5-methylaminomethyl-2-thiouridine)(34)-methyltransferase MnmD [Bacteroidia bacterium]|jgi:tRNA U34 5-methylaminomethyl-2-thiouridine-forming methyltransferase MnmC|nr:tRNA (5-methylaminomethyl-2-thiouridine)(34)-methyltransferase MnmD [Bacteroidia bacterium]
MESHMAGHWELKQTSDGSHTLYNEVLNEHYHSHHGALQESTHVFIRAGLDKLAFSGKTIRILEIGFGTGLNALLTLKEALEKNFSVVYTSLEPYPLTAEVASTLNYPVLPEFGMYSRVFMQMHACVDGILELNPAFTLIRKKETLDGFTSTGIFDLIYFDAFAPQIQPELWTEAVFQKMYACLVPGGLLVTYCAKGEVKRNMKNAGFVIERLPGPPGKREMTRAYKR